MLTSRLHARALALLGAAMACAAPCGAAARPAEALAPPAAPARAAPPAAPVPADAIDVRAFGARGDGAADDTAALQAALDAGAGKTVFVPRGTYLVFADGYRDGGRGGLVPRSGTRLVLAPDAILKARTTSSSDYVVVRLERVSDVSIRGGTIQGERQTHTGRDGEWGFGIGIFGATGVTIEDLTVRDCWGDGIFIEEALPDWSVTSRDVTLRNVVATGNRRQGLSVLGVDGLTVIDSVFEDTHGTAPSAGVDIEPGGYGHAVRRVTFLRCTFRRNAGRGVVLDATTGPDVSEVKIVGGTSEDNGWEGVAFHRVTGGALVTGMTVRGNGASGIYARRASRVTIGGNVVVGNSQRSDATFFGIHAQSSTGLVIRDNLVRREAGPRQQRYGLALEGSSEVTVARNDLRDSGRLGEVSGDGAADAHASPRPLALRASATARAEAAPSGEVRVDATRTTELTVAPEAGSPITILAPESAAPGQRLRFDVRNGSGSALGAVRWHEQYALASPWKSPPPGGAMAIDFAFDGERWVEVGRISSPPR